MDGLPYWKERLRGIKLLRDAYGLWRFMHLRAKAAFLLQADRFMHEDEALPVPPPLLRFRVHGSIDRKGFLDVGSRCARDIEAALASRGLQIEDFRNILDFGCGCGRVMRHFLPKIHPIRFTGTDIDKEAIRWDGNLSSSVRWIANDPLPPTPFEDAEFDFIYGISVFTHLDEDYQDAWLKELARITRPGGFLLLTVHGRSTFDILSAEEKAKLEQKGFLFKVLRTGRLKLDGLPDFYQVAFHSPGYVSESWSRHFKIVAHIERGIHDHQDAVLLHKE